LLFKLLYNSLDFVSKMANVLQRSSRPAHSRFGMNISSFSESRKGTLFARNIRRFCSVMFRSFFRKTSSSMCIVYLLDKLKTDGGVSIVGHGACFNVFE